MSRMNYQTAAELFPSRRVSFRGSVGYRRFDSAATAIKFAIEEMPGELLLGAFLEVGDERFDSSAIRQLYESDDYPLIRDRRKSTPMNAAGKPAARRNAEALMDKIQRRDSNLKFEETRSREALAAKTQRLRELRLAKEAEDKEAAASAENAAKELNTAKPKRSRQT